VPFGFAPPHFAVAGLATQALIRNRKTSVTCNVKQNPLRGFCLTGGGQARSQARRYADFA